MVDKGADPNNLTMYIIDKDGVMRAYPYQMPAERRATDKNPSGSADNTSAGSEVGGSDGRSNG